MKKIVSISFLLFANIILLASAVVPHHHHSYDPSVIYFAHQDHCVAVGHCCEEANLPTDQQGDTHNQTDTDDCLLQQSYINAGNNKQLSPSPDLGFDVLPCVLSLLFGNIVPNTDHLQGLPFRQKPYLHSYHTEFISQSLGLRAPPVC
ncbi:MAG: hypothetical protein LBH82_01185 [Bacteroidales bacterium]|nr:hypothetical protein [Bacteroidales bacterium]